MRRVETWARQMRHVPPAGMDGGLSTSGGRARARLGVAQDGGMGVLAVSRGCIGGGEMGRNRGWPWASGSGVTPSHPVIGPGFIAGPPARR